MSGENPVLGEQIWWLLMDKFLLQEKNRIYRRSTVTIPNRKIKTHVLMAAPKRHRRQEAFLDPFSRGDLFLKPPFFLMFKGCS